MQPASLFVWVHADSFHHSVASPFDSFVTNLVIERIRHSYMRTEGSRHDPEADCAERASPGAGGHLCVDMRVARVSASMLVLTTTWF